MKTYTLSLLGLIWVSPAVLADLPLTVENLLSDKGKLRFEFSVGYLNSEQTGVDASEPIAIATGENSYVTVPTRVGSVLTNTDAWVATTGLRYGLTKKTELYGRFSTIATDRRARDASGVNHQDTDSHFADAWVGLNYQFRDDIDKPAWLGFAELQAAERLPNGDTVYGKSLIAGFTTYQTYDPIVLSLTGSVKLNQERSYGGNDYKPGHSVNLAPSVGFAVNDKVTLSTGLNWRMSLKDEMNDTTNSLRRTQTSLDLGVGYALSKHDTLNLNARSLVSGEGDVQVKLNWIHRLEK